MAVAGMRSYRHPFTLRRRVCISRVRRTRTRKTQCTCTATSAAAPESSASSTSSSTAFGRQEVDLEREKARFWAGSGYGGRSDESEAQDGDSTGKWGREKLYGDAGALPRWDGSWPPPWYDALEPWTAGDAAGDGGGRVEEPSGEEMQSLLFELMERGSTAARVRAVIGQRELKLRQRRSFGASGAAASLQRAIGVKELLCLIATISRARDLATAGLVHDYAVDEQLPMLCKHYMWLARLRLQDSNGYGVVEKPGTARADEGVVECMTWLMRSGATPSADACEFIAGLQFYHRMHVDCTRAETDAARADAALSSVVDWLRAETDVGRTLFEHFVGEWERRHADTSTWEAAVDGSKWSEIEAELAAHDGKNAIDKDGNGIIERMVQGSSDAWETPSQSLTATPADSDAGVSGGGGDNGGTDSSTSATRVRFGPETVIEAFEREEREQIEAARAELQRKELARIEKRRQKHQTDAADRDEGRRSQPNDNDNDSDGQSSSSSASTSSSASLASDAHAPSTDANLSSAPSTLSLDEQLASFRLIDDILLADASSSSSSSSSYKDDDHNNS